ncbi:MAG: UDP-N-acetylglucosamine 2-epimerase (non-hydrolyzing) [Armatimonadetes bacterium]|nr:UDP-N-acetylglucosamine 2-epimerase (non-hydrolyzing) [Armatimonadota bacterium]
MAPVILELRKHADLGTRIVASGQHREMLRQVLHAFNLTEDRNFDVMKERQSLAYLTSSILTALDQLLEEERPDLVLAQGDTTTTFVAGLAAFYREIPFGHVEAGLRTDTIYSPFPEEFNRRAASQVTRLHFAPTHAAAQNLLADRVSAESVFVTGNTSIDAILEVTRRLGPSEPFAPGRMLLVTTHRRENWGEPQRRICRALMRVLDAVPDTHVVLPMHPNEAVRRTLRDELGGSDRVFLIEPQDYPSFARLMLASHLILTDSGGIQEEAPSLGKPVLVLRDETERPEGVAEGNAILVGTDKERIFTEAKRLLSDENPLPLAEVRDRKARNPYGDGKAAQRIVSHVRRFLGLEAEELPPFSHP